MEHWADGGRTALDNLVLLCRRHHRAVHEEDFRVTVDAAGSVQFSGPDGRPWPEAPLAPTWTGPALKPTNDALAAAGIEIDADTATPRGAASGSTSNTLCGCCGGPAASRPRNEPRRCMAVFSTCRLRKLRNVVRRGFDALRNDTTREYLINSYARMVYHVMLRDSRVRDDRRHCAAIAMKLRRELLSGEKTIRSMDVRDERRKLSGGCTYCGRPAETMDHLIPRLRHGPDSADTLVPACRWCNSSKGGRDVLEWGRSKGFFPVPVLRRYLVLAWRWAERAELLDAPLEALRASSPPFLVGDIPWSASKPVTLAVRELPDQPMVEQTES